MVSIAEIASGISDVSILKLEDIKHKILITYDRDFGELIFNKKLSSPRTVIYSRLGRAEPRFVADNIMLLLEQDLLDHHMYVIARDGVRSRPFPEREK